MDNRSRERNQSRFAERLGQRLLGQRAANPTVAVFERMDALEVEMSCSGTGQRGHPACAFVPPDEAVHLGHHHVGRRRFIVDSAFVVGAGDHLHRFLVLPVSTDHREPAALAHERPVPPPQRFMVEWSSEGPVDFHHHPGDPGLGRRDAPRVATEAEVTPDRRLHRGAVQDLSLDRRGVERLVAQPLDPQVGPVPVG